MSASTQKTQTKLHQQRAAKQAELAAKPSPLTAAQLKKDIALLEKHLVINGQRP